MRGDPATRAFSTFGFREGKLAAVESVNRAGDHAAAKRIIGTTKTLTPEEAADRLPSFCGSCMRSSRRSNRQGACCVPAVAVGGMDVAGLDGSAGIDPLLPTRPAQRKGGKR
jgi:hypothetical protein